MIFTYIFWIFWSWYIIVLFSHYLNQVPQFPSGICQFCLFFIALSLQCNVEFASIITNDPTPPGSGSLPPGGGGAGSSPGAPPSGGGASPGGGSSSPPPPPSGGSGAPDAGGPNP